MTNSQKWKRRDEEFFYGLHKTDFLKMDVETSPTTYASLHLEAGI
jgi:hypothetical protein